MKLPVKRHEVQQPLDKSYRLIPLTQGQNAIVDAEDFEWLNLWNWCAERNAGRFVASNGGAGMRLKMHRLILSCSKGEEVDHINHNTLDNRKENLRKCTRRQNGRNVRKCITKKSSQYKGVCLDKTTQRWMANIIVNGKHIFLGRFDSEKEAACAYNGAAVVAFEEFACLNQV